jgi:hypothetical protein
VVSSFSLNGCSSSGNGGAANAVEESSGSASGKKSDDLEDKWIAACEKDYQSSECYQAYESLFTGYERINSISLGSLLFRIDPFVNPEKSDACITDPRGQSCSALRVVGDFYPKDLICKKIPELGPSFYCLTEILVKNISKLPVDDFFSATLNDDGGTVFANNVEGTFAGSEYEKKRAILELNPGETKSLHWGFAVPDISRVFTSLSVVPETGDEPKMTISLCKKNSGDQIQIKDRAEMAIYEDASLLNSCKYEHPGGYINRLTGFPI